MLKKRLTRQDFPEAFNGRFAPATTNRRCPKCGSRNLTLTEQIEAFTSWEVRDGRLNRQGGIHEFGGAVGLWGECSECEHHWRVKGAIQIVDVATDLDPETIKTLE